MSISKECVADIRRRAEDPNVFGLTSVKLAELLDLCDEVERLQEELSTYREIGETEKVKRVVDWADKVERAVSSGIVSSLERTALCTAVRALRKPSPQPVTLSAEDSETLRYLLNERKPITPEMSAKVRQLYQHLGLEW